MNNIIIILDDENKILIEKDPDTGIVAVRHMACGFGDAGDEWKEINKMNCDL